jgi:hypothetical protein
VEISKFWKAELKGNAYAEKGLIMFVCEKKVTGTDFQFIHFEGSCSGIDVKNNSKVDVSFDVITYGELQEGSDKELEYLWNSLVLRDFSECAVLIDYEKPWDREEVQFLASAADIHHIYFSSGKVNREGKLYYDLHDDECWGVFTDGCHYVVGEDFRSADDQGMLSCAMESRDIAWLGTCLSEIDEQEELPIEAIDSVY